MSSSPEVNNSFEDPWQLGEDLLLEAQKLAEFMALRDTVKAQTQRKLERRLMALTSQQRNQPAFIEAPLIVAPTEQGVGFGPGQISGTIVGFTWAQYPSINEQFEVGKDETGLMVLVSSGGVNESTAEAAQAWKHSLLPAGLPTTGITGIIAGVPLIPGTKIAKLSELETSPDNVSEFFAAAAEQTAPPQDYMQFVRRIDVITKRQAIAHEMVDKAMISALSLELRRMNFTSPLLGKLVVVTSNDLRFPNPDKPGRFLKATGGLPGVLRKFVYEPYVHEGELCGGVQAVIWPPAIYERVQRGEMTPQEADKLPVTGFVPLSLPHKLELLTSEEDN